MALTTLAPAAGQGPDEVMSDYNINSGSDTTGVHLISPPRKFVDKNAIRAL